MSFWLRKIKKKIGPQSVKRLVKVLRNIISIGTIREPKRPRKQK